MQNQAKRQAPDVSKTLSDVRDLLGGLQKSFSALLQFFDVRTGTTLKSQVVEVVDYDSTDDLTFIRSYDSDDVSMTRKKFLVVPEDKRAVYPAGITIWKPVVNKKLAASHVFSDDGTGTAQTCSMYYRSDP